MHTCLAIILSAFLAGAGCSTLPTREPRYQGRSLTYWLNDYARTQFANDPEPWTPAWTDEDRAVRARAESAVRQIGTNALPFLLKMVTSKYELKDYW